VKLSLGIVVFGLVFGIETLALADTVYLKNGRLMQGVVTRENEDSVELAIGIGSVKFYREQIDRIVYSTESAKKALEQSWVQEQTQGVFEVKTERSGIRLIVAATLNGKTNARLTVDSSAPNVLLSLNKAKEAGLEINDSTPDTTIKMGDGQEAKVKMLKLNSLNIQGAEVKDVDVAVLSTDASTGDSDGLLGLSYLKSFKFDINTEQGKMTLRR
jgi:clan AA aspartic protease (TIGR02281 family)